MKSGLVVHAHQEQVFPRKRRVSLHQPDKISLDVNEVAVDDLRALPPFVGVRDIEL